MIGPTIGGFLDEIYGWKAAFVLTLAFGIVATVFVYFDLGETNSNRTTSFAAQFRSYPELLGSSRFWAYAATAAFSAGAFFAFLGGGPFVATDMLGLAPSGYGVYFGIISAGYMLGNFLSGRFSPTVGINRMMLAGNVIATLGMVLAFILFGAGLNHPLSLFGPAFFTGVGNGVTLPNANAGIVSIRPDLAGSASGLGGALQIGGGALLSVLAGALLTLDIRPLPAALDVMLLSSTAALFASLFVMRNARAAGARPDDEGARRRPGPRRRPLEPHGRRRQDAADARRRPMLGACASNAWRRRSDRLAISANGDPGHASPPARTAGPARHAAPAARDRWPACLPACEWAAHDGARIASRHRGRRYAVLPARSGRTPGRRAIGTDPARSRSPRHPAAAHPVFALWPVIAARRPRRHLAQAAETSASRPFLDKPSDMSPCRLRPDRSSGRRLSTRSSTSTRPTILPARNRSWQDRA